MHESVYDVYVITCSQLFSFFRHLRIKITQGLNVLIDSGPLYDTAITGGHLGVFVMGQTAVSWSNLVTRCDVRENEAIILSGGEDYVELATAQDYGILHRCVCVCVCVCV